jgi:hypothetical protein
MNENTTMPQAPQMPAAPQAPVAPVTPTTAPAPTSAPQSTSQNTPQNNGGNSGYDLDIVGKVNMPVTQLFEATGFVDLGKQFPTSNAFLMFVPGVPDQTKATGRSYDQSKRETMKIANRDLFALAEALKYAAMYKQCDFMIFTDSNKFAGTQQGQGVTKKVTISAAPSTRDPNKHKVFLTYNGQGKVSIALDPWHAIGLGEQLKALAIATENEKYKKEKERMVKNT